MEKKTIAAMSVGIATLLSIMSSPQAMAAELDESVDNSTEVSSTIDDGTQTVYNEEEAEVSDDANIEDEENVEETPDNSSDDLSDSSSDEPAAPATGNIRDYIPDWTPHGESEAEKNQEGNIVEGAEDETRDSSEGVKGANRGEASDISNLIDENGHVFIKKSDAETVIIPLLTDKGRVLLHWNSAEDGKSGAIYQIGEKYAIGTDEKLFAVWSDNKFTYKLVDKNAEVVEEITTEGVKEGLFETIIDAKAGDVVGISPEDIGLSFEFNVEDEAFSFNLIPVGASGAVLDFDTNSVVMPEADDESASDFIVFYEAQVIREGEVVSTSQVGVKFNATTNVETGLRYAPVFEGLDCEYTEDAFTLEDTKNIEDVAPVMEGYEFLTAEIDGEEVISIGPNGYTVKDENGDIIDVTFEDEDITEENQEVELVYHYAVIETDYDVEFEGVDEDDIPEMEETEIEDVTDIDKLAPEIEGYEFDHAEIDGKVVTKIDSYKYFAEDEELEDGGKWIIQEKAEADSVEITLVYNATDMLQVEFEGLDKDDMPEKFRIELEENEEALVDEIAPMIDGYVFLYAEVDGVKVESVAKDKYLVADETEWTSVDKKVKIKFVYEIGTDFIGENEDASSDVSSSDASNSESSVSESSDNVSDDESVSDSDMVNESEESDDVVSEVTGGNASSDASSVDAE